MYRASVATASSSKHVAIARALIDATHMSVITARDLGTGLEEFFFLWRKPLAGSAVLCDTAMQRQPVTESTGKPDAIRATSKMSLISSISMRSVSDIKLIRTDTTLDLSQKAEKVCSMRAPAV